MNNKTKEAALLVLLATMDGLLGNMKNLKLQGELARRFASLRTFIQNPGAEWEPQPSGTTIPGSGLPPATTVPPVANSAAPPWHPDNPANVGKVAVYGGHPGTWGSAQEGNVAGLVSGYNPALRYDNVTGNPAWLHENNPSYRWDGNQWVRP